MGRGRAARTLTPLLQAGGHEIMWSWAPSDRTPVAELAPVTLVLLAVPDAAIGEAVSRLADRASAVDEIWLHLSGATPGARARHDETRPRSAGALHPLQALPGTPTDADHLAGVTAGIDGEPAAMEAAERLALSLGMRPRRLSPETKPLYHAAAVHVAGHATALFTQGLEMMGAAGLTPEQAATALWPLMEGAVKNLRDADPSEVITGPVARGDAATVARHIAALEAKLPELAPAYRALARRALRLSRAQLGPDEVASLTRLLAVPDDG